MPQINVMRLIQAQLRPSSVPTRVAFWSNANYQAFVDALSALGVNYEVHSELTLDVYDDSVEVRNYASELGADT